MIQITREADDPLALRATIGGAGVAGAGNYYLVYRGDPLEVLAMLRTVVKAAERELSEQARRPQG